MDDKKIMKLISVFKDLDQYEKENIVKMLKGIDAFIAIEEIGNEVFRPARKHGYSENEINDCLKECGDNGHELVSLLEEKFYEILKSRNLLDHI